MGFYFRKSVNLGGLRFNFSKSGVGVSTGVKGFRIGKGPRGNYVQMGRNGIYYRKTWGGQSNSKNQSKMRYDNHTNYQPVKTDNDDIDTYNTANIYDSSSKELIDEITAKNKKITLKWFSLFFAFLGFWPLFISFIIFAIIDNRRKNTIIFYDIDEETEAKLQEFYNSFNELSTCNKKWYILSRNTIFDLKKNSGASSLVNRAPTIIKNSKPKHIKTNVSVPSIIVGNQTLYFLPDKLLIIEGKKVGALSYKNIHIQVFNQNFIETEGIPRDATIVNYTYRFVNKKGGPDLRYSYNPRIPILSYSHIIFTGDNDFKEEIMLSKSDVGYALKNEIQKLQFDDNFNENILVKDVFENKITDDDNINSIIQQTKEVADENDIINNNKVTNEILKESIEDDDIDNSLFEQVKDYALTLDEISTARIQRKFKLGYSKASAIMDELEKQGIISEYKVGQPRKVIHKLNTSNENINDTIQQEEIHNEVVQKNKEENANEVKTIQTNKNKRKNMFYKD